MAIQIDLNNSQFGVPFAAAYYRIVSVSINRLRIETGKPKFIVSIDIAGYGTSTPTDDTREVDFRRYSVDLVDIEAQNSTEFISKCYNWIMSQSDMQGSVQV